MAKYTRFDPRNKKKGRNKKNYLLRNTKKRFEDEENYIHIMEKTYVHTRKSRPGLQ